MDVSPPAIAGPVAARTARVFRFAIEEPRTVRERNKRRLAVAEYLAGLERTSRATRRPAVLGVAATGPAREH